MHEHSSVLAHKNLTFVWDERAQSIISVEKLIPDDPAKAQALRWNLLEAYQAYRKNPHASVTLWRCPICWDPLLLAGRPNSAGFYVRHRKNPDFSCPFKNGSSLSLEQWNALRFNGQKESKRHIRIKNQIRSMLESWPGASSVLMEPTIRGIDKLSFKRPDVLAEIGGQTIAIEIQLSSTYIDVIVDRERFYRENGTIVLWVFDRFTHEGHRLYEKDIYYHHNANAFELSESALDATKSSGVPHLTCHYIAPEIRNSTHIDQSWQKADVPFSELTFCNKTFRAYWYDHDAVMGELKKKIGIEKHLLKLLELIKENKFAEDRMTGIATILEDLYLEADIPLPVPTITVGLIRMMEVIVSAREGVFVGELGAGQNANWAHWANTVFEYYREFAIAFMRVTNHYGLSGQFIHRAPWKKKKEAIKRQRMQGDHSEKVEWWPLFAILSPDCNWNV